ncbi:MAG: hypothetical protein GF315_08625 [candidate division Zixibacteria bacterium]|nr:hypothetical protein [candidate division Zixibacteria bacterium]
MMMKMLLVDDPKTLKLEEVDRDTRIILLEEKRTRNRKSNLIDKLRKNYPDSKLVVLIENGDFKQISKFKSDGIDECLLCNQPVSEFLTLIKWLGCGAIPEEHVDFGDFGLRTNRSRYKKPSYSEKFEELTDREKEVLKLIAEGNTNKQIADKLFLSVKTVEAHRSHIMEKLDAHDVTKLVRFAVRCGLIKA